MYCDSPAPSAGEDSIAHFLAEPELPWGVAGLLQKTWNWPQPWEGGQGLTPKKSQVPWSSTPSLLHKRFPVIRTDLPSPGLLPPCPISAQPNEARMPWAHPGLRKRLFIGSYSDIIFQTAFQSWDHRWDQDRRESSCDCGGRDVGLPICGAQLRTLL